jgi:cytochrome b561
MSNRYSGLSMAFHWLTAALVLAAFLLGPGGSEQRVYSAASDFDRTLHEVLGLSVFALTLLRLAWRPFSHPPQLPAAHAWMNRAAKVVEALLYCLLVVTPLAGISGAWLEGHPLTLGVLGEIPPLLPEKHALGAKIAEVHTFLGDTLLWMAGLHAAAALVHHFVLRDGVLATMLPFLRRPR